MYEHTNLKWENQSEFEKLSSNDFAHIYLKLNWNINYLKLAGKKIAN